LSSDGGLAPSSVVDPSLGGGPAAPFGDDGLGLELDELDEPPRIDAGGALLPSGEAPPPLSAEAPKSVVFGVVLISYLGAEGASKTARTRDEALRLAQEIAVEAREDFAGAVRRGDPGSLENAGALPRGVLEPAPEFVLFSLDKGAVSDPVDTPR